MGGGGNGRAVENLGRLKICTNGHGPLIKIATIPIYGYVEKSFSQN